jgi:hypothetical protein
VNANWLTCTINTPTTTPAIVLGMAPGQTAHQVIGTGPGDTFGPISLTSADLPANLQLSSVVLEGATSGSATLSGSATGGTLNLGSGATVDASGNFSGNYITSTQTVNQSSQAEINGTQTASLLQDGSSSTGNDASDGTTYIAPRFVASGTYAAGAFSMQVKASAARQTRQQRLPVSSTPIAQALRDHYSPPRRAWPTAR